MANGTDDLRLNLTFRIAVIGIAAVLFAFVLAILVFKNDDSPAETIVAVLGPVVAVVGTLAGYVAGQTAGAAGKERAEARADAASQRLEKIAITAPEVVQQARDKYPDLFERPDGEPTP